MKITVFTPLYNRAYTIKKVYESLKLQTFKNFEWVVVNDGSTDNSDYVMRNEIIPDQHFFEIIYKSTANGGKHHAINEGACCCTGELFLIVDSDDYILPNALQIIASVE